MGLKGAEVHYTELNEKGIPFLTKVYPRNVVHFALQKKFKDLRKHLLSICGQTNADMKPDVAANLEEGATVKCIEFDGDGIFLQGTWERFQDKFIPLETCVLKEEDGYHDWEALKEIADSIREETTQYLNGTVKVSDAETIAMWAAAKGKEEEFSMDKILSLPEDQLAKLAITIVEKGLGGIVNLPGEMETDSEHMESAVQELKQEFDISSADSISI